MDTIEDIIELELFYHFYQPLYYLTDWTKVGNEFFLRSKFYNETEELFTIAKKINRLYELDIKSINKAILHYFSSINRNKSEYIFLNVFPSTLSNPEFVRYWDQLFETHRYSYKNIVLEINEGEIMHNMDKIKKNINYLKDYDILFALDDLGKGDSSIINLLELEPNFVKLDGYFSKDLATSIKKQRIISAIANYCKGNARLILEGIENPEDLAMAKALGVDIGQGYVLGRPSPI